MRLSNSTATDTCNNIEYITYRTVPTIKDKEKYVTYTYKPKEAYIRSINKMLRGELPCQCTRCRTYE